MYCTRCNEKIKPVVAIDIDGTLGDYHGHFLKFAAGYLGLPEYFFKSNYYKGGTPFKEWFCSVTSSHERTWNDIKLAYRQGAQKRSMPAYDHATDLCESVRSTGAELWLTTTRPYMRLDNVDPDTRFWLELSEIEYDGLIYDKLKYERLYDIVGEGRVVAVLDDLWYQCKYADQEFGVGTAILRRSPYNARDKWLPAAATLDTAGRMIVERVHEWIAGHEFVELETTDDSARNT